MLDIIVKVDAQIAKKLISWIKWLLYRNTPNYVAGVKLRKEIIRRQSDLELAEARINSTFPFDTPPTRNYIPKRGLF